jgi:hypothetical protein
MNFFRSVVTDEGDSNVSVGSMCMVFAIVIYMTIFCFAFFMHRSMPVDGLGFAAILGSIYIPKKGFQAWKARGQSEYNCQGTLHTNGEKVGY